MDATRGEGRRKDRTGRQLSTSVTYKALLPRVSYMLIKLPYTSVYKISASITEKHSSAYNQLVTAVQEVVIYLLKSHTHTQSW